MKLENKRIIFFTSMKKSPGKSGKEAVYSFFEGWSTMDINTTPPILPIFFSCLLPLKNSHSLSCNYVPIVKTCGHVNLPRGNDGHEDVCLIKKNEVCDFFYNQSLEKLTKHFINLRNKCILKNKFFSYFKI